MERFFHDHRCSAIATEFPNKDVYPLFYEAKRLEFIIESGDMLYIPAGWYHLVISDKADEQTGLNVAINYFYETEWVSTHPDRQYPIKTTHNIHKKIDYMKQIDKCGKILCTECVNNRYTHHSNRCPQTEHDKCIDHHLTLEELCKMRDKGSCFYIAAHSDICLLEFDPKGSTCGKTTTSAWWINFGNVTSRLHYDGKDNLLCQIAGRKRLILFPHSEWPKLYLINPYPPEFLNHIQQLLELHT
jgi:hypothetical protein